VAHFEPIADWTIHPYAAMRALERARATIGLVNFRVHDLRRTAATKMEELGTPPHVISYVLKHISVSKSTITKKVYSAYTYEREKREALNAWSLKLEEITSRVSNQIAAF
jgi:integrase